MVLALCLQAPARAATYEAAGQKFVASGSTFSSIGGYSTNGMTFAGNGGMMLFNAFSNLDSQISNIKATAVTSTNLESALNNLFLKYFGSGSDTNSLIWSLNYYASRLDAATRIGNKDLIHYIDEMKADTRDIADSLVYDGKSAASILDSIFYGINRRGLECTFFTGPSGNTVRVKSLLSGLSYLGDFLFRDFVLLSGESMLGIDGVRQSSIGSNVSFADLVNRGLLGLDADLTGVDGKTSVNLLSFDASGNAVVSTVGVDNLLDAIGLMTQEIQNPLAKLQHVLADDSDIHLKNEVSDNVDQVTEDFTGDGAGSVKPSDISSVAGFAGGIKDAFSGAGSPADIFSVMGDADVFRFFSQEVADDLDQTGAASARAAADVDSVVEGYMSAFYIDDDGFVRASAPSDSDWDAASYLEGLQ